MAVRFSEICLLIGAVFVVQLPVTRGQLCPPGLTFHALTGTCVALIRKQFIYSEAKNYCEDNFQSSTTKRSGRLVYIFDKATDDFVKGLLDEQSVDRAFIGLQHKLWNGIYGWGFLKIPANYTGWAHNPHRPDYNKSAVVITKDGWQDYDRNSPTYFVCQVYADLPISKMVCPVAEVGQESPDITCTIDSHQFFSITGVRFMKTSEVVASCDAYRCLKGQGYGQVVDVSKPPITSTSAPWTLKLRNVSISDAAGWTCSVEFSNSGYWLASQPCSLNVYIKPADIQCSHQFVQATVRITCTAAQVYPQVRCSWTVKYLKRPITVYGQTISNDEVSGEEYYRATCNASFNITYAGRYGVTIVMAPTLPNFRRDVEKKISVSVVPPQQPPQLYQAGQIRQSSLVDVVENQTLTLTCQVPGGDPPVYRTIITCDNTPQSFESNSSSVTMDVRVTRAFHVWNCICSALHAASYAKTSGVKIRVTYPATVSLFRITSRSTSTSVNRGDKITFVCSAENPVSQLLVQRQNGPTFTNSSTDYIIYRKTATCSDTGNYVCQASNMIQGKHYLDSRVTHLQVRCTYQFTDPDSLSQIYTGQVNGAVSINLNVFGYPEPTVTLSSTKHILSSDAYTLNYTQLEPPYGTVLLVINIQNARFFQNYSLNIINTEGPLTYSFEIVERDPVKPVFEKGGSALGDMGATVVGVVAAVIVIIIIVVIIFLLRRKGAPCKRKDQENANTSMQFTKLTNQDQAMS